jgi:hypothetical protein
MVDLKKVKVVMEWTRLINVFKVRSFLGLAGYYRCFIKGFLKLWAPFTTLTKKNTLYVRTNKCEHSFQKLKRRLVTALVLALLTESGNFVM